MQFFSVSLSRLKFSSENPLFSKNVYDELKVYSEALCVFDFKKKDCYTYANRKWQVEYPFVMCDNEGGACQVCQIAHRCENRYNRALEAVISPAYASKDYMRDRDNKRISYRGFPPPRLSVHVRTRQATLFCASRLILPYCALSTLHVTHTHTYTYSAS